MKPLIVFLSLMACAHAWQPAANSMLTEWGAQVTAETLATIHREAGILD